MNYRKRIKIAPGLYANISNRGVSTTIGGKGLSVSVGKRGTYLNTSIPGTGLYSRRKIGGTSKSGSTPNKASNSSSNATCLGLIALVIFLTVISGNFFTEQLAENWGLRFIICCLIAIALVGIISLFQVLWSKSFTMPAIRKQMAEALEDEEKEAINLTDEDIAIVKERKAECGNKDFLYVFDTFINSRKRMVLESLYARRSQELQKRSDFSNRTIQQYYSENQEKLEAIDDSYPLIITDLLDVADLSEEEIQQYSTLSKAFDDLCKSKKIWKIVSSNTNSDKKASAATVVDRQEISLFGAPFLNLVVGDLTIPHFIDQDGNDIYIYPRFVIIDKGASDFSVLPLDIASSISVWQNFIEDDDAPADAKFLNYTWAYVNKNGQPDARYSHNPRQNVYRYANLSILGLKVKMQVSNYLASDNFAKALSDLIGSASLSQEIDEPKILQIDNHANNIEKVNNPYGITEQYFYLCLDQANQIRRYVNKLNRDVEFINFVNNLDGLEFFDQSELFPKYNNRLACLLLMDFISTFDYLGHSFDMTSKEILCPTILISQLLNNGTQFDYTQIESLYYKVVPSIKNVFATFLNMRTQDAAANYTYNIINIFEAYDKDRIQAYKTLLYRYASLVAKADGTIQPNEIEYLATLMKDIDNKKNKVKDKSIDNKNSEMKNNPTKKNSPEKSLKNNPSKDLEALIGLQSVKTEVSKLTNFIKIQQVREIQGLKTSPISYHCVFTGNPGTGKTTVARIIAEIYKELGILKKGHLVETDRSGLVAEYVGQTAVKTNKIIDSALDGVLFIDEAYSLVQGSGNDFGIEAISTLLKRMEDDRQRLVVILAGYGDEMKNFIDANPGLQSRFNRYIHFDDYTSDQLIEIFKLNIKKHDYTISEKAIEKLSEVVQNAVANKDKNFGNARYVRNLFEKTLENQASRLASEPKLTKELLQEITDDDITTI